MARRLTRPTTTGALLAATVLALSACSGGGDGTTGDAPADGASGGASPTDGTDEGDGAEAQGGPPEPVELGALGDLVGVGSGYALFGSGDGGELVEGRTVEYQTLASMTGPVGWETQPLTSADLALSDAGLFATGQKEESSLEAGWVVARLDPETGEEQWSVEAKDPNAVDDAGCDYLASGGTHVALMCTDGSGDTTRDLTFLDAESGDEQFTIPGIEGADPDVVSFDPIVVQAAQEDDDVPYGVHVFDPATGDELAAHDDLDLYCSGEAMAPCGFGFDGKLLVRGGAVDDFGADGSVALVDPVTLDVAWSVGDPDGGTRVLGGGPDGVIVASSQTANAVLLDAATGEDLASTEIVDDLLFDRSEGIFPIGDGGTYVSDGRGSHATSDEVDSDWMISLASLFPDG